MQLTSIHRYPVKSCRGEDLDSAEVEPWGLAGDRRWMVVDPEGRVITAREAHRLLTIHPVITDTGLRLTSPGAATLEVDTPDPDEQTPVQIWKSSLTAAVATSSGAWLSEVLDRPARLVYLDDPTRRPTSASYSHPDDRVSFADGYPLLITTQASLAALNTALAEGGAAPIGMHRFRPNVVVDGAVPWAEDDWRRVRVGEATFRAVKGCARCVMTTLEPDHSTGEVARGKDPIRTLARIRRFGGETWFGVNLIPDTPGTTIRSGDEVEVLEAVAPGGGPVGA